MSRNPLMSFEDDVIDRLARIEEQTSVGTVAVADHETRLRSVEQKQWALAGLAAVAAPLLAKLGLHWPVI